MAPRLRLALLPVLASGLALAGCYGSTHPATGVHPDRATLNAYGTADGGGTRAYFEYWPTGSSGETRTTDPRSIPAGASGPFAQPIAPEWLVTAPLRQNTAYSFRLCGSDASHAAVCAQTETFTTPRGDSVVGGVQYVNSVRIPDMVRVSAWSGPDGQSPGGTVSIERPDSSSFDGHVTCLSVHGTRAAIGSVGTWRSGATTTTKGVLLEIDVSTDPAETRVDRPVLAGGATPPACPADPAATLVPWGRAGSCRTAEAQPGLTATT